MGQALSDVCVSEFPHDATKLRYSGMDSAVSMSFEATAFAYHGESRSIYAATSTPRSLQATKLACEPLPEALLGRIVGNGALSVGAFETAPDFLKEVKVVLDVLEACVIGQLLEQ